MACLVELSNIHGHRLYVNTDYIRRVEPRNENPPTTVVVYSCAEGERYFEVDGYVDEVAMMLNEKMR
ncbi:ATP-dependent DNA helicase RuvA [Kingella negevensis]|uniref:Uncharacterized protein n=2 Tax=Kingella negevensis TaxID=1522312 RepID=A0A238TBR8_9NEIS|nr:hypothetical protein [Kingella negevensis]MDK4709552.1 ATP-dependent DNA helicase RuvA [Kingella negevensis]WII94105.1 ATP-dependent DNA helicase RuvA [Kingella negevensis]SNB73495.1 Uncharacterised protein [Kingella negevensis]